MDPADVDWIKSGTRFGAEDIVFFAAREERSMDEVLGDIDLIVTGPHATGALPAEMAPWVNSGLTRRLQYDFTDVSTSPVARQWASTDGRVLYIENPHPRAVRDANRVRPADIEASLREAFARLSAEPGGRPSLVGVDAIRPVTFGYLPVLNKPLDDEDWRRLAAVLSEVMSRGIDVYETVRDKLIDRVIEAKLRRLHQIDRSKTSTTMWNSMTRLDVLSIHDTMNLTARSDGAICVERKPEDRLPSVVALSNRGDAQGECRESDHCGLRAEADLPTMRPERLRSIGNAYRKAFGAWESEDVEFNRPYLGGHETQVLGPRLRALEPRCVVRPDQSPPRQLRLAAWQNEFLREFLLGDEAVAELTRPGTHWVTPASERAAQIARRLRYAHNLVRQRGESVASQ